MAFLKYNRLWKPAADLFLRAKSSIKTITRNQSILTSTSKFLLDRDKSQNYRQRQTVGHFTNFFGNGPSYFRYYSVDDHDKWIEDSGELDRFLTCLENDEPYNYAYVLLRAPYLCSKYKCERRFLTVFERWWPMLESLKKENGWKPTSIVFHLGVLNKNNDGIIIEKLSKIDRLKSLKTLIDEAAAVDFCSLPDRHDVTSFLTGIRDLTMDTKFKKVLHPSLIPSRTELFKNIDKYLRGKESVRKRQHDQNPSVKSEWVFMIAKEAPHIFSRLAFDFRISYSDLNNFERDVLKRLCGLIKEGYDYSVKTPVIVYDDIKGYRMDYSSFAHAWLLWRTVDPDDLVHGVWRSWFSVYQVYSRRIGSNDESSIVHGFNVCGTLVGVCEHFRKIDSFLPIFDIWLDDVRKLSPLVARLDPNQGDFGDVVESFTEFVYNAGQCCKYFALDNQRDLKPILWIVAADALDAFKGKSVTSTALCRYLTGIRDFRSAMSKSSGSNISCPTHFNDELLKYLNGWMDHELLRFADRQTTREALLGDSARLIILLCRSKIKLDGELLRKLLTPLRGQNSRSVFDGDEQKLGIIVASFGEAMCDYSSTFDHLQVPKDVMTGYFELAKRFLEKFDPNKKGIQAYIAHYSYVVGAVLRVAYRFKPIKEFEILKQIWQKRMFELVNRLGPKDVALMTKRMEQLRKFAGVQFDSKLQEKLRRRGEEFERKR